MEIIYYLIFVSFLSLFVVMVLGLVGFQCISWIGEVEELEEIQFSYSILFGTVFFCLLIPLMFVFGLDSNAMRSFMLILFLSSSSYYLKDFLRIIRNIKGLLFIWLLYVLFCTSSILNTDLNIDKFVLSDIQAQFGLPIDNLLPFQTMRYVTEQINPNVLDPAPNWKFGDRGPILGLVSGALLLVLGIKEQLPWLSSSYPASITFEIIGIVLNSIFLIPTFGLVKKITNEKTAYFALLFLIINPFIFINVVFTWPKLFAAAFGVLTFNVLYSKNPRPVFAGALFSLGFLAHESIILTLLAFLIFIFTRSKFVDVIKFLLSFILMQTPWLLYKSIYSQLSSNLLYYNMLCLNASQAEGRGFIDLIKQIISEKGLFEVLKIKLNNFLYPINFTHVDWLSLIKNMTLIQSTTDILFYQFIYAVGLVPFVYLVLRVFSPKAIRIRQFILYLLTCLFSVAILQGCPLSSWNHIWSYLPLIATTTVFAIDIYQRPKSLMYVISISHVLISLLYLRNYIWFPPRSVERFVAYSPREIVLQTIFLLICFLLYKRFSKTVLPL